MYDALPHTDTPQHRTHTALTTRPPRTTRGLLVVLMPAIVLTLAALALTYPVVVGAGFAGLLIGAGGAIGIRRLVDRDRRPPGDATDRAAVVPR